MFTFGSDPEFMIINSQNKLKTAIPLLPNKNVPLIVEGSKFYYDNVLAEIAINPADSYYDVIYNTKRAFENLNSIIHPLNFIIRAADNYTTRELLDKDATEICEGLEWNAYTLKCIVPPKETIATTPFRTAGGHIHLGVDFDSYQNLSLVKMMDLFIGIPSLFLDKDPSSIKRRSMYGKAGMHRTPNYGIEYRTLGNFWLSSPELTGLIYNLCDFAINFVKEEKYTKFWSVDEKLLDSEDPSMAYNCFGYNLNLLESAINNCDLDIADNFMTFISNYLPNEIVYEIEKIATKPFSENISQNWKI